MLLPLFTDCADRIPVYYSTDGSNCQAPGADRRNPGGGTSAEDRRQSENSCYRIRHSDRTKYRIFLNILLTILWINIKIYLKAGRLRIKSNAFSGFPSNTLCGRTRSDVFARTVFLTETPQYGKSIFVLRKRSVTVTYSSGYILAVFCLRGLV